MISLADQDLPKKRKSATPSLRAHLEPPAFESTDPVMEASFFRSWIRKAEERRAKRIAEANHQAA